MAESQQHTGTNKEEPPFKQSVVSAEWNHLAPQQHDLSSVHDRLEPFTPQSQSVTTKDAPYNHLYKSELIINKLNTGNDVGSAAAVCFKCKRQFNNTQMSEIRFNNRIYHSLCFNCGVCNKNLKDFPNIKFSITDNGEPMCSHCELGSAKVCANCGTRIVTGNVLTFNGMSYHSECFRCGECHKSMADQPKFHVHNMKPCCAQCFERSVAPRCAKCSRPISVGSIITYESKKYHEDCFCCGLCNKPINEPKYYSHHGEPCCTKCYNERIASRCAHCFSIISDGKSITSDGKHYHVDCYCCGLCRKPLANSKEVFKHNDKPCCKECHEKHFVPLCAKCREPITDIKFTTYQNENFHINCFTCTKCGRAIHSTENFYSTQIGVLCFQCNK